MNIFKRIFKNTDTAFDFSIKGNEYVKQYKINKNISKIFFKFFIDTYQDFRLNIGVKYNNTKYAYEMFINTNQIILNKYVFAYNIPKVVSILNYMIETAENIDLTNDLNCIFDANYLNKKICSLLSSNRHMLSINYISTVDDINMLNKFSINIEKELNKLIK